ncbi:MAG TPA: hypothetical protein EYQ73_00155 [Candidatus Poseidoniales archaeon]|nr:MAG: hypothetical protein CXT71_07605 [Euryarchaeota archaeon]HIF45203.1 hypothetical protein [Candidatus Poseidoniales archaeon]HIL65362.1 hypothetical protein [Candidatus Poseidoniales archaeon]
MGILKRTGIHLAGIGIGGSLGILSSILTLYLLVDASVNGAEQPVWLMLCVLVGLVVGGICYRIVIWASKNSTFLN